MAVDLVIKGGKIVTAAGVLAMDLAIDKGRIVCLSDGPFLPKAKKEMDADGLYILPGLVDPHVHLGTHHPFDKSARSETCAAACGGVTTQGIFLRPKEGLLKVFPEYRRTYEGNALIDAFFHALVLDEDGLAAVSRCPGIGITSFKFLLGYKGPQAEKYGLRSLDDGGFFEALETIGKMSAPCCAMVHAENIDIALRLMERLRKQGRADMAAWNDSRPALCEEESMSRCIFLAEQANCPLYIVHMTIGQGVELSAKAKARGAKLIIETCPQYLTHNSEEPVAVLRDNPALGNVNPPLRDKGSNERLWQAIRDGVIDCVGSDHAAVTLAQKGTDLWNAPMGLGNITEMILPVMLSEGVNKGRISLEKVAEVCSTNPARVFGLYPKKGVVAVGSDADLVLVDLNKKVNVTADALHSICDWSIYQGWEFTGWPVMTLVRGMPVAQDGKILGQPGLGRYLPRATPVLKREG